MSQGEPSKPALLGVVRSHRPVDRAVRDAAIRAALASGATYREVSEASGLSRAMLDRIRRGGQPVVSTRA